MATLNVTWKRSKKLFHLRNAYVYECSQMFWILAQAAIQSTKYTKNDVLLLSNSLQTTNSTPSIYEKIVRCSFTWSLQRLLSNKLEENFVRSKQLYYFVRDIRRTVKWLMKTYRLMGTINPQVIGSSTAWDVLVLFYLCDTKFNSLMEYFSLSWYNDGPGKDNSTA